MSFESQAACECGGRQEGGSAADENVGWEASTPSVIIQITELLASSFQDWQLWR